MTPPSRLLEVLAWAAGLLPHYVPTWGAVDVAYSLREYEAGRHDLEGELLRQALGTRR